MRVRVAYTENYEDDYRMALRHSFGECGTVATREELKNYARLVGSSNDEDLMYEWGECPDCQAQRDG